MTKQNHSPKRTTPKENSVLVDPVIFAKPSEFNLSEKRINFRMLAVKDDGEGIDSIWYRAFLEEDVKEAVRLLKEKFKNFSRGEEATVALNIIGVHSIIDKIFGEKLT